MSTLTINLHPTRKQDEAWEYLEDSITTELLFGGGAGGGKSRLLCEWILKNCLRYPGSRWLSGRSVLKSLKESTLLTFFEVCNEWEFKAGAHYRYNQQDNIITFWTGSTVYLKDLFAYPSDPNFDSLGSTEFTGAGVDEANQVSHRAKEVVRSRLRYKLDHFDLIPKLFMSCNPAKNWVYSDFYLPWKNGTLPPERAFVQALVTDNPYISPHYIESLRSLQDKALVSMAHTTHPSCQRPKRCWPGNLVANGTLLNRFVEASLVGLCVGVWNKTKARPKATSNVRSMPLLNR